MKRSIRKDERGLAYVAAAVLIFMIVTAAYTVYQAYGVPAVCKKFEAGALSDFLQDAEALAAVQKQVIRSDAPSAVPVRFQYSYPVIPFFLTPRYLSIGSGVYNISVTISNVASDDVSIPTTLSFSGEGVWLKFNALYSTPVTAFVELGMVATDGAYLSGSIVSDGVIELPFFAGPAVTRQLYPQSAGGSGIVIKPYNPAQNITITISGSRIPENVWKEYAQSARLNVSFVNGNVVISLPPQKYVLVAGVTSFGQVSPPTKSAAYLIARTATSQLSPAVIDVQALDEYFNPVKTTINLTCVIGCPVQACVPTPTGLSCTYIGTTSYYAKEASAVVSRSTAGTSIVVASVSRSSGGPYQIAFSVTYQ